MRKLLILLLFFTINCKVTEFNSCNDPLASNYNPSSAFNDGSCIYNSSSITPDSSWILPEALSESSGLIIWDGKIWTHNDNSDTNLYAFDITNINSYLSYPLNGIENTDWEEISQDDNYIYIGDFGNNSNGNRDDLKIYRIEKSSILTDTQVIDTIHFKYSTQTDFSSKGPNNTDYDCEAFLVTSDSIFLFTKQWVSQKTSIYSLPKQPGNYVANYKSTFNVMGLITGATFMESEKLVVLCGYTTILQPFIYLLYDFRDNDFFSGNKRKIPLNLSFHQIEGIATEDGLKYFISGEYFSYSTVTVPQKLHMIDLTEYLHNYLNNIPEKRKKNKKNFLMLSTLFYR